MLIRPVVLSVFLSASAFAQVTSVDLGRYSLAAKHDLPAVEASEASAITYNWDNGNLYVLGDEGDALAEVNAQGALLSAMTLTGFEDTEGLTYIGEGRFVLVEERLQDLYPFTYRAGGAIDRSDLQSVSLGDTVGNVGLEGVAFDPLTGLYFAVKEKTPQAVLQAKVDFESGGVSVGPLFDPAGLGMLDLSDVHALATVRSLHGTADQDNLLIYSQESALLLEVGRDGTVKSSLSLSGLSSTAEGVTIDDDGTVYICDETPTLYVFKPCLADCDASGGLDIDDFVCFQTLFGVGDAQADCDGSGRLDIDDFICFQSLFGIDCG